MLDRYALQLFRPVIDKAARWSCERGFSADQLTLAGFASGMAAAILIIAGFPLAAIVFILLSRALDGIDGALARLSHVSDRGAFLDIALDFVFYAAIPLSFALANPAANALSASVLLAAFVATGASFLAFAVIAEKRGLKSSAYPSKSFYYLGGLTEGTETILCFIAMCWWPSQFAAIAYLYAALCFLTVITRLAQGWKVFGGG